MRSRNLFASDCKPFMRCVQCRDLLNRLILGCQWRWRALHLKRPAMLQAVRRLNQFLTQCCKTVWTSADHRWSLRWWTYHSRFAQWAQRFWTFRTVLLCQLRPLFQKLSPILLVHRLYSESDRVRTQVSLTLKTFLPFLCKWFKI